MEVQVISSTVQKFNGESFYLCGFYYQRKGKRLHRTVWEYHNGAIPSGYHVHHADENRSNNQIDNLRLVKAEKHLSDHMKSPDRIEQSKITLQKAIPKAPEWHASEEGREWHSEHAKQYWDNAPENTYCCDFCGVEYQSQKVMVKGNHFCSNKCKSAFRRKIGIDSERRVCPECGKSFVTSKYSKNVTCGYECARKRRWGK